MQLTQNKATQNNTHLVPAYSRPLPSLWSFYCDDMNIIFKIFSNVIFIILAKLVRWDRVEDLLAYGLLMLGLLVLPTSLVTGRYS